MGTWWLHVPGMPLMLWIQSQLCRSLLIKINKNLTNWSRFEYCRWPRRMEPLYLLLDCSLSDITPSIVSTVKPIDLLISAEWYSILLCTQLITTHFINLSSCSFAQGGSIRTHDEWGGWGEFEVAPSIQVSGLIIFYQSASLISLEYPYWC